MLHKVRNGHREILNGLPELKALLPSSVRNKKMLLEMAERGEPRPNRNHPLARVLSNYSRKKSATYDPDFAQKIHKLAPHWFVGQKGRSEEKKKTLLEMARRDDPRPIPDRAPLGWALNNYIKKSSKAYDPIFAKRIRKLAPHWFFANKKRVEEKKKALLEMARRGDPRPSHERTRLGKSLSSYIRKCSKAYDPAFTKQMKKLAPHWFQKCSTR